MRPTCVASIWASQLERHVAVLLNIRIKMSQIRRTKRNRTGRKQDRSSRSIRNPRRRRFALTLNNPTVGDCLKWDELVLCGNVAAGAKNLTYFVVQTEKGDGTDMTPLGTIHYQAYAEFRKAIEWSSVKKIFGDRIHIENARASAASNIRYCTKKQTRVRGLDICVQGQWGTPKSTGSIMICAVKALEGCPLDKLVDEHPAVALVHMTQLENLVAYAKGPRKDRPKITMLIGATGCGKSQHCMKNYGWNAYWVSPPASGKVWFGHYYGQDVVVFDDFHDHWFMLTHLLRIFDSTPLMVAPKGGQVPFNSAHLVVTSNVDPRDWYSGYKGKKAHKDALERRIVDFAEIWDCSMEEMPTGMGHTVTGFRKVKRTNTFKFREAGTVWNFDDDSTSRRLRSLYANSGY